MADINKLNKTYQTKEKLTSSGMNNITGKVDELVTAANKQAASTSDMASKMKEVSVKTISGKKWLVFDTYTPVTPVVPTPVVPTITLDTTAKTVTLSATTGLTIKYTDQAEGTPTTAYTQAIDVSNGATIKAITTNSDNESSSVPSIMIIYQETENGGTLAFPAGSKYTKNGGAETQYSTPIEPAEGEEYVVTSAGSTATINITA